MIEVREARYFLALAEELHFGRAARRLHISQPPLSQAIKTLESRLRVQLVDRSTRHVVLTPAGQVFLDQCRQLVARAEAAEESVRAAADGRLGTLRIGAVNSAIESMLRVALPAYLATRPGVEVRVTEHNSRRAIADLRAGTIDVALCRLVGTPPGLRRLSLQVDEFVLAVPRAWADRYGDGPLEQAAADPWIWLPRDLAEGYHDQVTAACRAAGFTPSTPHHAHSIRSQLTMVEYGLGVALVPQSSIRSAAVATFRVEPAASIEMSAVWPAVASPLRDDFLATLRVPENRRVGEARLR